jgi:hypothetical protein
LGWLRRVIAVTTESQPGRPQSSTNRAKSETASPSPWRKQDFFRRRRRTGYVATLALLFGFVAWVRFANFVFVWAGAVAAEMEIAGATHRRR